MPPELILWDRAALELGLRALIGNRMLWGERGAKKGELLRSSEPHAYTSSHTELLSPPPGLTPPGLTWIDLTSPLCLDNSYLSFKS